jgi:AcrR family transcriptional regulator
MPEKSLLRRFYEPYNRFVNQVRWQYACRCGLRQKIEVNMITTGVRKVAGARREAILDAAEALVMDLGAAHLTMDAVASRANVSKGGVLHHFPAKTDLIMAMLARLLAVFRNDMDMIERVAGATLKDHLRAWVRLMQTTDTKLNRISAALLSVSANEPQLLTPFADLMQKRIKRYRDGNDHFGPTLVILTALDGYWLFSALGLEPIRASDMEAFFSALYTMIDAL